MPTNSDIDGGDDQNPPAAFKTVSIPPSETP